MTCKANADDFFFFSFLDDPKCTLFFWFFVFLFFFGEKKTYSYFLFNPSGLYHLLTYLLTVLLQRIDHVALFNQADPGDVGSGRSQCLGQPHELLHTHG